ncbi:MAG: sigma-70 family RNA polymerase sigma factor [Alphaproteobacteria bacterium]|nr:sigma-70 family RNA polymerase sigma factor [Alphaproteobacteria bacterium]
MSDRSQEELLVLKAQAGNRRAFDTLYRSYQPSLVKFAYRLTNNLAVAEDAVQEAWVTIARTIKDFENPSHFRARIFKAVRWRVIDNLKKIRSGHQSIDETVEVAAPDQGFWATQGQIIALISKLPTEEQQAIYLFYLEELKVDEIATVMDVPAGTIKSRLNRARGRLRTLLEGEENGFD